MKNNNIHIGETITAKNGRTVSIIAWHSQSNIDVQFEDLTVVRGITYDQFLNGWVKYPENRRGEKSVALNGQSMTITAYRTSHDIDVVFEDGTEVFHKTYDLFKNGEIANPNFNGHRAKKQKQHFMETVMSNKGQKMTLVRYDSPKDIDVVFEDGTRVNHVNYPAFQRGSLKNPSRKSNSLKPIPKNLSERVWERVVNKDGKTCMIVAVRNKKDFDVLFDDGVILQCTSYTVFKNGNFTHKSEKKPAEKVVLFNHNKETYDRLIEMLKESSRVGIVQPTGTGKSFIILKLIEDNPDKKFVYISPSREIQKQFKKHVRDINENLLKCVNFITYQKLQRMSAESIKDLVADYIIIDEYHRVGAKEWEPVVNLILDTHNNTKAVGLSATPVRFLDKSRDMSIEVFDNNLACEITLTDAIESDLLPAPTYIPVWYDFDEKKQDYRKTIELLQGKERQDAKKLLKNSIRHLEESYGVDVILKKYLSSSSGKFIVFCNSVEHVHAMTPVLSEWFKNAGQDVHIYMSYNSNVFVDEFNQFMDDDSNSIRLLLVIDRFNEGVHVDGIDGVIMLRPTESPIIYFQQMGRALASKGKTPLIFDFVNNYGSIKRKTPQLNGNEFFGFDTENELADSKMFHIYEDCMRFNDILQNIENCIYFDRETQWLKMFYMCLAYKEKYGYWPNTSTIVDGVHLGKWMVHQRRLFKGGMLSAEREKMLRDADFPFNPLNEQWMKTFHMCLAYKEKYGYWPIYSTIVDGVHLGRWITKQRNDFQNGVLSAEREKMLRDVGFSFDPFDEQWMKTFHMCLAYKEKHGCWPNTSTIVDGVHLGAWASAQRVKFKKKTLSVEREKMLRDAGFVFNLFDEQWMNTFHMCLAYKEKHGCWPNTSTIVDGVHLGMWVSRQRRKLKNGKLSAEYEKMLRDAGFPFN